MALTSLVTVIAYSSFVDAQRTATASYSPYTSGSYASYPYNNSTYPTYPYTPTYPTYSIQPAYPQQQAYPYPYQPGYGYSYPYGSYGEREGGYYWSGGE